LAPVAAEAVRRWVAAGITPAEAAVLRQAKVRVAALPGDLLGLAEGKTVRLDADAAGRGWFVDPTPGDDAEFADGIDHGQQGRVDLLTAVAHELGHLLGRADLDPAAHPGDLMAGELVAGERRVPAPQTGGG